MKKVKKLKINRLLFFILFSILIFPASSKKNIQEIKQSENKETETAEVEIIEKDETDYDKKDDGELIYLDRIVDEEEIKSDKKGKLEKAIRRFDKKINPVLKFYVPATYGDWYVIKTTNTQELNYENIKYNFKQEENGYRITKMYYDPLRKVWNEDKERAWIKEKKGKVYLHSEKTRFKSFKNEIIYFDPEYKYMIIKFENDNSLRVFSRYPEGKISLIGEEKEKYERVLDENPGLRNTDYNDKLKFPDKVRAEIEKSEQEQRAKVIEEKLNQGVDSFFQIN